MAVPARCTNPAEVAGSGLFSHESRRKWPGSGLFLHAMANGSNRQLPAFAPTPAGGCAHEARPFASCGGWRYAMARGVVASADGLLMRPTEPASPTVVTGMPSSETHSERRRAHAQRDHEVVELGGGALPSAFEGGDVALHVHELGREHLGTGRHEAPHDVDEVLKKMPGPICSTIS